MSKEIVATGWEVVDGEIVSESAGVRWEMWEDPRSCKRNIRIEIPDIFLQRATQAELGKLNSIFEILKDLSR